MATANLCIVHGTIASELKIGVDQTSGKQCVSFWLSYPSYDSKTSLMTPVRLLGDVANAVRELPLNSKLIVEGKLRASETHPFLKVIEAWDASW